MLGVAGPVGSGKSSLLSAILGEVKANFKVPFEYRENFRVVQ